MAAYFLERYRGEMGKDLSYITEEALDLMKAYPWPGNVRELENVIERAVVMSHRDRLEAENLPEHLSGETGGLSGSAGETVTFKEAKSRFEQQFLREMLQKHKGNVMRTAKAIGIPRRNLQTKIKMYNIEVEPFRK